MMGNYFAHDTACIDNGAKIGEGTKIWHFCHVMEGARIGKNCKIGQNVVVHSTVVVGDNVRVQNNVSLYDGVTIEDNVFCGPSCVFTNIINPRAEVPRNSEEHYRKTVVSEGATIGANATIVCGIRIGRYAFIGAGAVVTKDVPDYGLMVGNPAKRVGWMSEHGEKLEFQNNGAMCPATKAKYALSGDKVTKV